MNRTHRPRWVATVLVGTAILVGCSSTPVVANPDTNATASGIIDALNTDDQTSFTHLFARSASPERVQGLWANLIAIRLLSITAQPDGSWQTAWQLPGEQGIATHLVEPRWLCDAGGCLLEDIGPRSGSPAPIWLGEAIGVRQTAGVTLVGAGDLTQWADPAERAAEFVGDQQVAGLIRPADTQVIEVPADSRDFEQVMGASIFDFADTGALTWIADSGGTAPQGETAPARIVVNPVVTEQANADSRYLLLVHEQTHAATSWLGHPASGRLWLSEGLAEWMMLQASPEAQQRSDQALTDACPLTPVPPADADFSDPAKADLAYAWSAAAVGRLIDRPAAASVIGTLWNSPDTPDADLELGSPPVGCP